MKVSIIGNIDKRVIAYPLMRALAINGKTAVFTDDGSFKRLYVNDGNSGVIDNVEVYVTPEVNIDSDKDIDKTSEEIMHELFVSDSFVYPDSDATIIVRGIDRSMSILRDVEEEEEEDIEFEDDDKLEEEKQTKFEVVVSTSNEHKIKGVKVLGPDILKYLWDTEEYKTLLKVKDKTLVKILEPIVSNLMGVSTGDVAKLLSRDMVIS